MGTITFSNVERVSVGGQNGACLATMNGSSSYATDGDSLDFSTLPFSIIDSINFSGVSASTDYIANFVPASQKIKFLTLSGTISGGTVDPASAGTPSGTNAASAVVATGTTSLAYAEQTVSANFNKKYLYTGAIVGTPVAGATLAQAVTGATATVSNVGPTYLKLSAVVGTFSTVDLVTGTNPDLSTFTFTPVETLVEVWALTSSVAVISGAASDTNQVLTQKPSINFLSANTYRVTSANTLETLTSDNWTDLALTYLPPSNGVAVSGTADPQTFNGNAMGNHSHGISGLSGSSALVEVTNGTNMSSVSDRVLIFGSR